MIAELIVLRLVHVLAGSYWVGAAAFSVFFLVPALGEAGPAAGGVMAGLQKRRLMVVMPAVAALTLLSGFRLIWIVSGGFAPGFIASGRGLTYTAAGAIATLAFLLGMFVNRPMNIRLASIAGQLASAPDGERLALQVQMQRLRVRAAQVGVGVVILLIVATAGMAVARYL